MPKVHGSGLGLAALCPCSQGSSTHSPCVSPAPAAATMLPMASTMGREGEGSLSPCTLRPPALGQPSRACCHIFPLLPPCLFSLCCPINCCCYREKDKDEAACSVGLDRMTGRGKLSLASPSKGQRSCSSDRGLCLSTAVIRAFLGAFGSLLSSQNAMISQTSQGVLWIPVPPGSLSVAAQVPARCCALRTILRHKPPRLRDGSIRSQLAAQLNSFHPKAPR